MKKIFSQKWITATLCLAASVGLVACQNWIDLATVKQGKWSSEWAIPLLDADLSLKDMMSKKKGNLTILEDGNGFYTFIYTSEYKSETAETYISLPTQKVDTLRLAPPSNRVGTIAPNTTFSLTDQNQTVDFQVAATDQKLRFIDLKSGNLKMFISSTFKHNIRVTVTIPSLTKNGVAFAKAYQLSSNGTTIPVPSTDDVALSGYRLDLSNGSSSGFNKMTYQIKTEVQTVGTSISATDRVKVTFSVDAPKFSYIEGYLGKFAAANHKDSVFIGIFDSKLAGQVFIEDPKIRMTISNSFGVGARARISNRIGKANYTADSVLIFKGADLLNPLDIPAAVRGLTAQKLVEVNKSNSNVQGIFNPAPREILYNAIAEINGQSSTTALNNFALDTSRIGVKGEVEIPFEGRTMEFYSVHDSSEAKFPNNKNIENVQMNIYARNGFPAEVDAQVYFLNASDQVIDSIITERGLPGKEFLLNKATDQDGNGKIDSYESQLTERQFMMDSQRYAFLKANAKKIRIYGRIRSSGAEQGKSIKIYSYYRLRLKVGIILGVTTG
jgi:hypothetical protein